MRFTICAVFDSAVGAFNVPMFFRSKGEAVRSFAAAVNDEKSEFRKNATDYSFHFIGEYDDQKAEFFPILPVKLLLASECLEDDVFPPSKRLPM